VKVLRQLLVFLWVKFVLYIVESIREVRSTQGSFLSPIFLAIKKPQALV
jgi:hypothetical protein